jgi:plastocyanin
VTGRVRSGRLTGEGTLTTICFLALVPAASWLLVAPASFAAPARPKAASCSPSGTALTITAFDFKFDKECLAAPANEALTIDFNNLDRSIPHNVAIYRDRTAQETLFKGDLVDGPGKTTYSVPALTEGTFFFRCDPHPEMNGTFISG